jgi:hypothetical protein
MVGIILGKHTSIYATEISIGPVRSCIGKQCEVIYKNFTHDTLILAFCGWWGIWTKSSFSQLFPVFAQ